MNAVLTDLDGKYDFNWMRISEKSGVNRGAIYNLENGKDVKLSTISKVINALPITPEERQELINSYFEPKE